MIGKSKLKKTIKFITVISFLLIISCNDKKKNIAIDSTEDKVEVLNVNGKNVLNQAIYYKNNDSIEYSKSQFYEVYNKKCIKYHSVFDTLKTKIGVNRYIIFKTSDLLKPDFSNINDIKLEEYFFMNANYLCVVRGKNPNYGVIEDIVFLKSDSIIKGEKSKRIKTIYQYINFKNSPKWTKRSEYKPDPSWREQK